MSRVAKKPIFLSEDVNIDTNDGYFLVSGAKGVVNVPNPVNLKVDVDINRISFVFDSLYKENNKNAGLLRSLLNNAVQGVTLGFTKVLILKGLGFRVSIDNNNLSLLLGYSHKVLYNIPKDVEITVEKDTIIKVFGVDKQRVGQVCAEIRSKKIPDNYHAKGILYQGENIILKEGKKK